MLRITFPENYMVNMIVSHPSLTTRSVSARDGTENTSQDSTVLPWSHEDALALYRANEGYAQLAVNRFLRDYPKTVSSVIDNEDLLSDACLVLWRCCEVYDVSRATRITTLAFKAIQNRLIDIWKQNNLRIENGEFVSIPHCISLSDPISEGGNVTISDSVPARSGGGNWGSDGLSAMLHVEQLKKARDIWDARDAYRRGRSPDMAAEMEAVASIQNLTR